MEAIYIPQLTKAFERTETIEIHEHLPGLESLTPVQGYVRVTHRGTFLEVSGKAETIATLACDRCLKQYNYRLKVDTSEMIWLEEPVAEEPGMEREIPFEDFVEKLSPSGYFKPAEWLYEQLCLALPHRQPCDQQCGGIAVEDVVPPQIDRRWASLESLKSHLN